MGADELLTVAEVAAELGRSVASVRAYSRHYGLAVVRRDNRTYVRRGVLDAWRADNADMLTTGDRLYARRKAAVPA